MITKWKVFNFKSIREETELTFGPLTIFAGANSSGKSTFIQSILLVAQTLANKVSSRSVVLNGTFTSLGQFDDLKSNDGSSDQIVIECTCSPLSEADEAFVQRGMVRSSRGNIFYGLRSRPLKEVACEISFDADLSSSQRDIFQIQPRLFAAKLSCTSRDEDNIDQKAEISVRQSSKALSEIEGTLNAQAFDDSLRAGLAYSVALDDSSLAEVNEDLHSAKPVGCVLRHFLPEQIIHRIDTVQENAKSITAALQNDRNSYGFVGNIRKLLLPKEVVSILHDVLNKSDIGFEVSLRDGQQTTLFGEEIESMSFRAWNELLRSVQPKTRMALHQAFREFDDLFDRICEALKKSSDTPEAFDLVTLPPPGQLMEASSYLDYFFSSSLKYLGPLRDAPKPLYPLAPAADPHDVGLRGEHTASILELHKNKMIKYIPPVHFKEPMIDRKTVTRTLETAVIDWLQYLGVATKVSSRDKGKLGYELKVGMANSDAMYDLTHVGVGVSQVLPILVMCLLADTDTTLVFEQPELHLHPKVQTLLGDFFLSMALCNKQCIVETHSEYFIDRLRFRIAAAAPGHEINNQTKIYFVEKPEQSSNFREVVINEYGAIPDWPDGFFDQSQQQAEEILSAALLKKRAKRRRE